MVTGTAGFVGGHLLPELRRRFSEAALMDLARRLLDWTPQIPWERTIGDILADWRQRVRQA